MTDMGQVVTFNSRRDSPCHANPPGAASSFSRSIPLLDGRHGTEQTIDLIREVVDQALRDPFVIESAYAIVRHSGAAEHNDLAEVQAVFQWVLGNIRFFKDPPGHELVRNARWILQHRGGDCDDINAVLLPSLLGAIGYECRLVTVKADPTAPEEFTHIYAEVLVGDQWIPVDRARQNPQFGKPPERIYGKSHVWDLGSKRHGDLSGMKRPRGLNGIPGRGMGYDAAQLAQQISQTIQAATPLIIAETQGSQGIPVSYQGPGGNVYAGGVPPGTAITGPYGTSLMSTGGLFSSPITWGLLILVGIVAVKAVGR